MEQVLATTILSVLKALRHHPGTRTPGRLLPRLGIVLLQAHQSIKRKFFPYRLRRPAEKITRCVTIRDIGRLHHVHPHYVEADEIHAGPEPGIR